MKLTTLKDSHDMDKTNEDRKRKNVDSTTNIENVEKLKKETDRKRNRDNNADQIPETSNKLPDITNNRNETTTVAETLGHPLPNEALTISGDLHNSIATSSTESQAAAVSITGTKQPAPEVVQASIHNMLLH